MILENVSESTVITIPIGDRILTISPKSESANISIAVTDLRRIAGRMGPEIIQFILTNPVLESELVSESGIDPEYIKSNQ